MSKFYLISGLVALSYSLYAGIMYNSYNGKNLIDIDTANKMISEKKSKIYY